MEDDMKYVGFGARKLTNGIHLMTGCFHLAVDGRAFHTHLSAYLVIGESGNMLIDTGHPKDFRKIASYIRSVVGDDLTFIFPTHEEYPHAGNLGLLLDAFPRAIVVGETRNLHLYFPDQYIRERFQQSDAGDVIDLGGRRITVLPAVIRDLKASYWAYDDFDQALFVSDGFAFSHSDSNDCVLLSEELSQKPTVHDARQILDLALYWSRFADNSTVVVELRQMLNEYSTKIICPAHGSVITEPARLVPVMNEALLERP
ncbi:MBL fold metallo-hydrolase [Bradyrhizobium liaoningense]|uniref:MBL fold metallo-hydrolase n=1 Tax=Bradyrhizobium liaoningense TaxID=43992 RepID=UPI001BAB5ED3|nr:MBL fold metallo-hydrolase [Bradyrhizobium liaoningense]MBR0713908.1 FprA family A-type flavoprotein [Bradyrhizobium liaoningense]